MARIAESEINRLKEEVSVERLVEASGVELKKSGKNRLGRCPFHEDETASLVVTADKNLWHCFGCGVGGGPIDWVIKQRGVSFRHAVELLREGLAGGLPSLAAGPSVHAHATPTRTLAPPVALDADDQQLLDDTVGYYHQRLKQTPQALAYLNDRGLAQPELVDHFKLGVADRSLGLRLPEKNRKAGADIRARLQRIGLLRESGHEHFNGSLIIPVLDLAGHVREVYGRKLLDNLRAGTPKHLYLPGPHAGVFNEAGLVGAQEVILCEALIDALTFWCAGYRNVTASYGTQGFTADHLAALKRHGAERVLIAYDRDDAGERAAAELVPRLQEAGLGVWRILFPKGMDANEYALKVRPAGKSLGLLIRKAQWLGDGQAPQRAMPEAALLSEAVVASADRSPADGPPSLVAKEGGDDEGHAEAEQPRVPESGVVLPAAALPPAPAVGLDADVPVQVSEQEVVLHFGEGDERRRWRVRGLPKNLAVGVLKVNLMEVRIIGTTMVGMIIFRLVLKCLIP